MPADQLLTEGRAWLRRMTAMQGQRVTLKQHREILVLAGWVALLVGCVEYDTGNRQAAETTARRRYRSAWKPTTATSWGGRMRCASGST